MECHVEKDDLLRCLYLVQGVVEKRSSLPILAHVLIQSVDPDQPPDQEGQNNNIGISLGATDLEIGIRQNCQATVTKPGAITTDARKLYEIVRELPPEKVSLRTAGSGWIEVSSGKSRFRLASLDPKEFPAITPSQERGKETAASSVSLPSEILREMIEKTLFAASPDETRLNLSGVYAEATDTGKVRMVASDGHRLSLVERKASVSEAAVWPKVILPRKGLLEARKLLERSEGEAIFSIQGTTAGLKKDTTALSMRLVEGEFPDYQQIIPTEHNFVIPLLREDLLSALRRLLILTTERSRGIKLQVEKRKVEISVNTPDLGEGVEEVPTDYEGESIAVGFNGRYILEALTVMGEGQKISLSLKDDVSPGLLKMEEDPDFLYVIMPMRIF